MTFRFDKSEHKYYLGDRQLPSVTGVLSSSGLVDVRFFTEEGRRRGQLVHEAVNQDVKFGHYEIDPVYSGYMFAWERFMRESMFRPIKELCEVPSINLEHEYCGTADLFGLLNGRTALIDVKTGDSTYARWQLAAYENLEIYKHFHIERFGLLLKPDGDYRLIQYGDHQDFIEFLAFKNTACNHKRL